MSINQMKLNINISPGDIKSFTQYSVCMLANYKKTLKNSFWSLNISQDKHFSYLDDFCDELLQLMCAFLISLLGVLELHCV